jgi:TolB-like protein
MSLSPAFSEALAARYVLGEELGRGGMATVYRARDVRHDRDVALKVLDAELAASVGRERFSREIRLAARLTHPHILPLFDSGEAAGLLYYTMPVMAGETLRARLRGGPLPVEEAVRIATAVADALDHAHRHHVVHRDIKPENILLHEGHAVVADFGVGKAAAGADAAGAGVTQTGLAVGTPAYMSPEQALGDAVDGRSDLFALGCLLFEMLTGMPPFTGPTAQAALVSRLTQTPPAVRHHRPEIPEAVSRTVERLLEKAPEARLATGAEAARALSGELALAPRREVPSVAVLPFANMSADPDNAFFADGITDDIIVALTRLPGLKVAARASAFTFRGAEVELRQVGTALGVRHVLQGGVRRAGNRVRVTAQLMSVSDGTQQWTGRWDRDLDDIFAIQDEIAQGIVGELEVRLGAQEAAAPLVPRATADLVAYDLFLQGRENIRRRMPAAMRTGLEQFQQALARDPAFAQPWIGIAEAQAAMGSFGYQRTAQCRAAALHALDEARRLGAPATDVERHRIMVTLYVGTDWRDAAPLVDEVLRVAPHDAFANTMAALYYGLLDDPARLAVVAARAMAGDPLSPWTFSVLGLAWSYVGDIEQALAMNTRSVALDPDFTTALFFRPHYLVDVGRHEEAVASARRLVALSDRTPLSLATLSSTLWRTGARDEARRVLAELHAVPQETAIYLLAAEMVMDSEDRLAELLHRTLLEDVSAITMASFRTLLQLLDHPRLGPLLRQFPGFAQRRSLPPPGAPPARPA